MSEVVRFATAEGETLLVEVDDDAFGMDRISRDRAGVVEAGKRLEEALAAVLPAMRSVTTLVRDMSPDEHEIEFGIKLTAEASAMVAKTAAEAHIVVKLRWQRDPDRTTR
ncbi:CU044_2847 family protein [Actinoplanes sp. NPDC026670]|jgi:hypothetical protein|uniref:CU044_2847 family protein n=1 Tax=Actinoplanes sp. NPDC026670 TaxID=3154700 RepID=UPI0034030229